MKGAEMIKVEIEGPVVTKKTRKFVRPTTPEVEALFFRVAPKCTNREMLLLQWAMGRGGDSESVAQAFLNPPLLGTLP
jgi:hypothetical protein